MVVKAEIVSKDTIKPSCATPDHVQHLKLSLLDQLAPSFCVSILLFYSASDHDLKIIYATLGIRGPRVLPWKRKKGISECIISCLLTKDTSIYMDASAILTT